MDLSVKNTTREQRIQIVKEALIIASSSGTIPSEEALNITKKYIDGLCEIEDVQKEILNSFKKDGE